MVSSDADIILKMKISLSYLALMTALSPMASAWSIYANGKAIAVNQNVDIPCDKLSLKEGQSFSYYVGRLERCVLELFEDSRCDDWAGTSKDEWKNHKLTQDIGSYSVACFGW